MIKKIISIFLAFLLITVICFESRASTELNINAQAYVLVDLSTGRVLLEKNSDEKRPMASTTKIMTAIIALENGNLSSMIKVSPKAASVGGSSFWLKAGEELPLSEMLYGLLLPSGNDAATAIAEHIGGTQEDFVCMMNKKAVEIGALNTHFANPHGLDEPNHYTTAKDLAKIAAYAWHFDEFREIVKTKTINIDKGSYPRQISNTNRLLWDLEGTDGIKTGYTGKAGRCLVSTSNNKDFRLLSVVLGSGDHFRDSKILLEYGFSNYNPTRIVKRGKKYADISISDGVLNAVSLIAEDSIQLPVKEGENCKLKLILPQKINAPISQGQPIGQIHIYINDKYTCSTSLIAAEDVRQRTLKDICERLLYEWLWRYSLKTI